MCGPYVHGRSWVVGMRDVRDDDVLLPEEESVAEALSFKGVPVNFNDQYGPLKTPTNKWWRQINASSKVYSTKVLKEMQKKFDDLIINKMQQSVKKDMMDAFLYGKPQYLAIDPAMPLDKVEAPKEVQIEYDGKRQIQEYKHFCKRMECNAHNEMPQVPDRTPANSPSLQSFDWGIQPWDGKLVNQRTMMNPRLKVEIEKQNYMMNTKKDLFEWCEKHWGKHEDWGEWASRASSFFDIGKFLSFLPLKYKQGIGEYRLEGVAAQLAQGMLVDNDNPVEVFADMLNDAPNDYWKNK